MLVAYFEQLWRQPAYQLSLLLWFPGLLLLGWKLRTAVDRRSPILDVLRWSCVLAATALLCGAAAIGSPWLAFVVWIVAIALATTAFGGAGALRWIAPTLIFFLVFVRPSAQFERTFVGGVQALSARLADRVLDQWNVFHVLQGGVVAVSERRLLLEQTAVGASILIPALALAALLIACSKRSLLNALTVVASAPCWVVVSEGFRIAATAWLVEHKRIAADAGVLQFVLASAALGVALVLTFSFARIIDAAWRIRRRPQPEIEPQSEIEPQPMANAPKSALIVLAATAVLSLGIQFWDGNEPSAASRFEVDAAAWTRSLDRQDLMPDAIGSFRRGEQSAGPSVAIPAGRELSKAWNYRAPALNAFLALEKPVVDWFETVAHYRANGWIVGARKPIEVEIAGRKTPALEISFSHTAAARHGKAWFVLLDRSGAPCTPPTNAFAVQSLRQRIPSEMLLQLCDAGCRGPFLQIHLFVDGAEPLEEPVLAASRTLFEEALVRMFGAVSRQGGAP